MDQGLFDSIVQRSEALKVWVPSDVILETDKGSKINLMDYITDGNAERYSIALLKDSAVWKDPSNPKHRAELVKYINRACMKAGFAITVKAWKDLEGGGVLRLRCSQNRTFKGKVNGDVANGQKQQRQTSTSKPTCADEACPFIFNVHWFKEHGKWGLKAHTGKREHCGHVYLEEQNIKCTASKFLQESETQLINQGTVAHLTPAAIQTLVYQNCGVAVSANQIEQIRQVAEAPGYEVGRTTSAGKFIEWLKSQPKISYILLYDKSDSDLMRVRRPGRLQCTVRQANTMDEATRDITIPASGDIGDGPDAYIDRVRRAMKIPDTQRILLAASWCTDEERRMATLFPEIMGIDVTEQTNNEKRPLLVLGGLTGDNKTFTSCRAFLPSQQRWVFDWFLSTALPYLFPLDILQRNTVMFTDGDPKEYCAFAQSASKYFPNSYHHLCVWHLLDGGIRTHRLHPRGQDGIKTAYFNTAKSWIKSWFYTLETQKEFDDSYKRLFDWFASDNVQQILGIENVDAFINFITNNLMPYRSKWSHADFLYIRSFNRKSTQFLEAENGVMKCTPGGPTPNQALDKAAKNIDSQNERRLRLKCRDYAQALDSRCVDYLDDPINNDVNQYCLKKVMEQSILSDKFGVKRCSDLEFLVLYLRNGPNENEHDGCEDENDTLKGIIPKYIRTRIVSVHSRKYLKCTCGLFERCGYPCRHIYAVLKRRPITNDVIPRYHKHYAHYFTIDEQSTYIYKQALLGSIPGPLMIDTSMLQINICERIPDVYLRSLPDQNVCLSQGYSRESATNVEVVTVGSQRPQLLQCNTRFVQEQHLSQSSLAVYENNNGVDSNIKGDDSNDDEYNEYGEYINTGSESENLNENIENETVEEETGVRTEVQYKTLADSYNKSWYVSVQPIIQDLSKVAEANKTLREKLNKRMLDVWEESMAEYHEFVSNKKPTVLRTISNECPVVSSRTATKGPRFATRLRRADSPRKKRKNHSRYAQM